MRRSTMRTIATLLLLALTSACGPATTGGSAPTGATWTAIPDGPLSARYDPVAAWVAGRYVVVGGFSGDPCPANADCASNPAPRTDGASYDPATEQWQTIADAPVGVGATSGTSTVAGDVLYVQSSPDGLRRGDLLAYDVRADAWRRVQKPRTPYQYLTAAGDRLVAFDYEARRSEGSASVLDPDTGRWTPLPPDPLGPVTDRWLVGTGAGLVVAGHSVVPDDRAPVVRVAALDETLTRWGAEWTTDVVGWAPQFVNGRLVWASDQTVDGGEVNGWGRSYDEGGVLDPTTGRTTPLPLPPRQRTGGLGTAVQTDRYVSVGDGLLDPVSGSFLHVPDPPGGPRTSAAVVGGSDTVLVWGGAPTGHEADGSRADGYLLRP